MRQKPNTTAQPDPAPSFFGALIPQLNNAVTAEHRNSTGANLVPLIGEELAAAISATSAVDPSSATSIVPIFFPLWLGRISSRCPCPMLVMIQLPCFAAAELWSAAANRFPTSSLNTRREISWPPETPFITPSRKSSCLILSLEGGALYQNEQLLGLGILDLSIAWP